MRKMFSEPDGLPAATGAGTWRRLNLNGPTMGTRWSVRCDVDSRCDVEALRRELAGAVEQVDRQMSPWRPDSDLVRLNQAPTGLWASLPPELLAVLSRALEIGRLSGGAFDPAVGALVDAWGFGAARSEPDPEAIRLAARDLIHPAPDWLELDLTAGRACRHAPLQLDLCGIAKGYAVDQMTRVLQARGITHALVALDGELRALGGQADGTPWSVALESPLEGRRTTHGVIEMADLAVATSGDYRHWVRVGDARVAHTMDARRAAPVHHAVASVTVLAADCMSADAWATALLVAGPQEGPALAHRLGLEVLFLLRQPGRLVELGLGRFA